MAATEEEHSWLAAVSQFAARRLSRGQQALLVGPDGDLIPFPVSLFRVLRYASVSFRQGAIDQT